MRGVPQPDLHRARGYELPPAGYGHLILNSQYPGPGGTVPQPQVRNLNLHCLFSPAGAVTHGRAVGEHHWTPMGGRRNLSLGYWTTFRPMVASVLVLEIVGSPIIGNRPPPGRGIYYGLVLVGGLRAVCTAKRLFEPGWTKGSTLESSLNRVRHVGGQNLQTCRGG